MRVLVACEYSGRVRDAFIGGGHDALSCDLLPTEQPGPHYQGDVRNLLREMEFDLMIAHPPCTYLTSAGLHWNKRRPERAQLTDEALQFVQDLMNAPIPMIAIENPVGCIGTRIRPPDQILQPHDFGEDASKATCLWLKGLSPLVPVRRRTGRYVIVNKKFVERWSNQTDSGQNNLPPSGDRWQERSRTYEGVANAMATQWGAAALERAA